MAFSCCWLGLLLVCGLLACSCHVMRYFAITIWCTRAIMRCNRFSVFGGVVLSCVIVCDCGAFYKRLLYVLVDGVLVCVCTVSACGDGLCVRYYLLIAVGVRMVCTNFKCVDIYIYILMV